jgi:hypothetical protein
MGSGMDNNQDLVSEINIPDSQLCSVQKEACWRALCGLQELPQVGKGGFKRWCVNAWYMEVGTGHMDSRIKARSFLLVSIG